MRSRGSVLLVVLVVLLALTLIVVMTLRQGGNERRTATLERDRTEALALAEEGLSRSEGWLGTMLETQIDLDRALDPNLDTTCTVAGPLLTLGGTQADDHLPPFTDGVVVPSAGPAGLSWLQVSRSGGSYLLRVDDDADDMDPSLPAAATGNNGCPEGTAVAVGQNPVRDRDRTVVVTAVGLYTGTDVTRARATRAISATFGPGPPVGISVNGDVDMNGAAHVCGAFANVQATGNVLDSCLCGTACPGHAPCTVNDVCDAVAGGATCNTNAGASGGGTCQANQPVQPGPRVSPWDARNAPPICSGPACTPFHYLRWSGTESEVFLWNYGGTPLGGVGTCNDAAAWGRLCHPSDTVATCAGAGCWSLAYSGSASGGVAADVRLADSAATGTVPPPLIAPSGANPKVWEAKVGDDTDPGGMGCGGAPAPPYPWATGGAKGWDGSPTTTFEMRANGGSRVPRGVWFVEGNVKWKEDSPDCGSLPGGYSLTLLVLGDATFEEDASFKPASRRGVAVVTGRDFELRTGNTDVASCTPGAFMVREQATMGGNTTLEGQLVVDNVGTCSDEVTGTAFQMHGTAVLKVSAAPPIASGPLIQRRKWIESAW